MALIEGSGLGRYRFTDPSATLDEILANVRAAYQAGVIHADLSEFNILIEDGKCVIIDWPQWMETSHQNAVTILERDIGNILAFFERKYKLRMTPGKHCDA